MNSYTENKMVKISAIAYLCVISIVPQLGTTFGERIFISYLIIAVSILCVTYLSYLISGSKLVLALCMLFNISIIAAILSRTLPGQLYGFDPHISLYFVDELSTTGGLPETDNLRGGEKIQKYPNLFILLYSVVVFTGASNFMIVLIFPLLIVAIYPMIGALTTEDNHTIGALFWMVPVFYTLFASQAVPQMIAFPLFGVLLFLIIRSKPTIRMLLLFTIISISLIFSHSFTPVIAILVVFCGIWSYTVRMSSLRKFVIYVMIALFTWIINENELIIGGTAKFLLGISSRSVGQSSTGGAGIVSIFGINKYYFDWISIMSILFLLLLLGFIFLQKTIIRIKNDNLHLKIEEIILGVGGGITFIISLLAPISSKRGWVLLILLSGPITSIYSFIPSKKKFIYFAILFLIIGNSLILPFSTFSQTAEPESYGGYSIYHDAQTYPTVEFISGYHNGEKVIVSDLTFFLIEERYRIQHIDNYSCYVSKCTNSIVIWSDKYHSSWTSVTGEQKGGIESGKEYLEVNRHSIYTTGKSTIFYPY